MIYWWKSSNSQRLKLQLYGPIPPFWAWIGISLRAPSREYLSSWFALLEMQSVSDFPFSSLLQVFSSCYFLLHFPRIDSYTSQRFVRLGWLGYWPNLGAPSLGVPGPGVPSTSVPSPRISSLGNPIFGHGFNFLLNMNITIRTHGLNLSL